jgi:predicted Fe-Mo cluster-binding NifX family protein
MIIALASDSPSLEGTVPALFSETPYLVFVNAETGEPLGVTARSDLPGNREAQDIALAREILRRDCEGVLCGPIERPPFLIIADEGQVTRYLAAGMGLVEALAALETRSHTLIRDHIDGRGCQGEHKAGQGESACECGHRHDGD